MDNISYILEGFSKNWGFLLARGIFAILFGIFAIVFPGITLLALILLFGIYALIDGISAICVAISSKEWWLLFAGILGIIFGICTFFYPGITAVLLLYFIASWAIIRGIFEFISAIRLRKVISNEVFLMLGGIISLICGFVLIIFPITGIVAIVWVTGIYAIIFGIIMIVFSFRLHGLPKKLENSLK